MVRGVHFPKAEGLWLASPVSNHGTTPVMGLIATTVAPKGAGLRALSLAT